MATDSPPISPKASLALDLSPSCMQFCPSHSAYFVVGTYNLVDHQHDGGESTTTRTPQSRNGSLVVFRVDGDKLTKVQTVSQPSALLDLRFHPRPDKHKGVLAAVSNTGTLAVFRLDPAQSASAPLQHLATSRCQDLADDVLFLQCNWHPALDGAIAVTTSTGLARLLHLDSEWKMEAWTNLGINNSLEAWSIAFSPPTTAAPDQDGQTVSVYCGGDDASLRYTTLCSSNTGRLEMPYSPVTLKGHHDAGVTAILPLPLRAADGGRLVVTGSYDDRLRVLAVHDLDASHGVKQVRLVGDEDLGGGVWRLSLVDMASLGDGWPRVRILASCMHAGARLVEMVSRDGLRWACRVVARFEEHRSMNYASDCVTAADGEGLRCASTSFYDKLLCLWDYC